MFHVKQNDLVYIEECPICACNTFTNYVTCTDYTVSTQEFDIVECDACAMRFTNPIPEETKIGAYYQSEDYVSHSDTKKGIVNWLYHKVRTYSIKRKFKLVSKHASQNSLLDIGSGAGTFLGYVKGQNWSCCGLEPDEVARTYSIEKYGISVKPIDEVYDMRANSYNIITMWHVLEHVHKLNRFLEKVNTVLQPNGTFFVAVPNCSSYDAKKYKANWAAYDVPRHLYHFRPKQMERLMDKHGFVVTEILPMKFDSYYVSMLSEKIQGRFSLLGFWSGWMSNLKANRKNLAYSSLIYVIKHK